MDSTTPPPVDLSRLSGIIGTAKKLMETAEAKKPIVISKSLQEQTDIEEKTAPKYVPNSNPNGGSFSVEQIQASGLPANIKEVMIKKAVEAKAPMFEDYSELPSVPTSAASRQLNETDKLMLARSKALLTETSNSNSNDMITISRGELTSLIKETMLDYLSQDYNKRLTENVMRKTMSLLIKEGKLTLKK